MGKHNIVRNEGDSPPSSAEHAATSYVLPKNIMLLPKAKKKQSFRKRTKGRYMILTDTPEKIN